MKTFKDLEFEKMDTHFKAGARAALKFENGLGISVLTGAYSYSNGLHDSYEIAMLDDSGEILYTEITGYDVVGYLSKEEVSDYMKKIQSADKNGIESGNLWNLDDTDFITSHEEMEARPLTDEEKKEIELFEESMKEVDAYEAKLHAEREEIKLSYKKEEMIKSKTYQVLSAELLDDTITLNYNDNKIKILSHSVTSAGLSDRQFEILSDVYEDETDNTKQQIVISPVMYTVTFVYKDVHDIDVG